MPTLHVIDPLLKDARGHYLTQHLSLWSLCQQAGYQMVSYVHTSFDRNLLPTDIDVEKVFGHSCAAHLNGHYLAVLGNENERCYQDLLNLDVSGFESDDIVFITSVTAERCLAYGQWIQRYLSSTNAKVGLYCIVSSEVDDTLGRQLRRSGLKLSDGSFEELDQSITLNDLKRSLYRYLFSCISDENLSKVRIFYEEPFPNRGFLELAGDKALRFIHLHSMYPVNREKPIKSSQEKINITCLGSGGVGGMSKGGHLIVDVLAELEKNINAQYSIQLGQYHNELTPDHWLVQAHERLSFKQNVEVYKGFLEAQHYYEILEASDIVLLPYGPRYKHWMSGIFDECLFLGKVCVIPQGSKMAYWMEHHNLSFPCFGEWTAPSIANAVEDAVTNFSYYQTQFNEAKTICHRAWQRNNPIAAFN